MAIPKAGPSPLDDLSEFLAPFALLVRRRESRHALERYTTGLLGELPRKTASEMGRSVTETSGQRLQEFLTNTAWDSREMDRLRVRKMVERTTFWSTFTFRNSQDIPTSPSTYGLPRELPI